MNYFQNHNSILIGKSGIEQCYIRHNQSINQYTESINCLMLNNNLLHKLNNHLEQNLYMPHIPKLQSYMKYSLFLINNILPNMLSIPFPKQNIRDKERCNKYNFQRFPTQIKYNRNNSLYYCMTNSPSHYIMSSFQKIERTHYHIEYKRLH